MKEKVLSLSSISFRYPDSDTILNDVSFDVYEGEFIGIIGPNGGGKTTLLKLIMGFLSPQQGKIFVNKKSPTYYPNNVAYVPQMVKFDRAFPITLIDLVLGGRASNLSLFGRYSTKDKELAALAIKRVQLNGIENMPFSSLSGGQLQRALIARAIVSEPKILLLDEPTSHIDFASEKALLSLLYELKRDLKLSILMVTHDLGIMIEKVDRFLCVQGNVTATSANNICEHFALGLYHYPLKNSTHTEFPNKAHTSGGL